MIKKNITYVNFNGETVKGEFYFNLTQAELVMMEVEDGESMHKTLTDIVDAKDRSNIIKKFQKIIDSSYGKKSDDGKTFMKSPEILAEFKATQAYSDLFMELATNEVAATAFVKGIMPKDVTSVGPNVAKSENMQ